MTLGGPATSAPTKAPAAAERPRPGRRPWFVIGLELFISASAIYGGVGLIWNNVLGMPDDWLQGTPFTSWTLPGIFLLLVVAVPMAGAAALELRWSVWAPVASIAAGAAQVGWICVELLIMQEYNVLQPILCAMGLAVLLLAVWNHRHRPLFPEASREHPSA